MTTKGQAQAFVGARRSLGETTRMSWRSSGGAAYMQLFKGERLREDINGKKWNWN